ncbi:hypothetical protein [Amycolatopsis sp. WGS_07]|uniref:hypothetical protein n=1 Tax=Amycolatopsis sp. WGS_07 TaxID=3076764 RepID=UPI0038732D3D
MRLSDRAMFWAFLVIIGGLVLLVVGVANGKDATWWAAWGQWAGALGSVAAAGTAVWIAVIGWRKSDAQYREQAERDLASKFVAWIDHEQILLPSVMVANSGPLPMYRVQLEFDFPRPGTWTESWDKGSSARESRSSRSASSAREPSRTRIPDATKYLRQHLLDLTDEHLGKEAYVSSKQDTDSYELSTEAKVEIGNVVPFGWIEVHFSDSAGIRWTRTHEGKLMPHTGWS